MTAAHAPPGGWPQAGMGITSLVMAIANLLSIALLAVVAASAIATFHGSVDEETPFFYLLGTWILAIGLLSLCGIVFGIGGLRQSNRRRSAATLGLCINIAIPIGVMFLLLLALSGESGANGSRPDRPRGHIRTVQRAFEGSVEKTQSSTPIFGMPIVVGMSLWLYFKMKNRLLRNRIKALGSGDFHCPICHKQIPITAQFCRRCGLALPPRSGL